MTVLEDWLLERCWGMNDWPLPPCLPSFRDSLGLALMPLCLPGAVRHRARAQEIFVTFPWNSTKYSIPWAHPLGSCFLCKLRMAFLDSGSS